MQTDDNSALLVVTSSSAGLHITGASLSQWHCTFIPRWDPSEVCWRRCTSVTPVCCHVDTGRAANATRHLVTAPSWWQRHVPGMPCRCVSGPFHRRCCSAGNWRRHCFVRPTPEDCATAVTNNNFVQCLCNSHCDSVTLIFAFVCMSVCMYVGL